MTRESRRLELAALRWTAAQQGPMRPGDPLRFDPEVGRGKIPMLVTTLEEQALHQAALSYARTRFQTLEIRLRVDVAREVSGLLVEKDPTTDREVFTRDELEPALELARLTLLHAGEKDVHSGPDERRPSATEQLLHEVRKTVRRAQNDFGSNERAVSASLLAFGELIALVSTCRRMPGDPECSRYGDCPEHGRDRPGQCVPESGTGNRGPDTGVGSPP